MSVYRHVTITCDECGEVFDDGWSKGFREVRESAAREGWQHDKRGDTCPAHNGYTRDMLGWVKAEAAKP